MDAALALLGWMVAATVAATAAIYIACLELYLRRLERYAKQLGANFIAESRRASFWRNVAVDCQEGRAEEHKKTRIIPSGPSFPQQPR